MIMGSIREAKQVYTIPFLSVSLDLIQNAVQNKKLIGVRVSYIRGQDMKSWNLAVRGYNPTEQEVREGKASALLINWLGYIMREYDIDPEVHVLTSCTDSGSDVKRALEVELPTHREWCVSHLIHLALGDAVTVCCSAFCLLFCCHVRVCVSLTYTDWLLLLLSPCVVLSSKPAKGHTYVRETVSLSYVRMFLRWLAVCSSGRLRKWDFNGAGMAEQDTPATAADCPSTDAAVPISR
jgi:hypothetical protein